MKASEHLPTEADGQPAPFTPRVSMLANAMGKKPKPVLASAVIQAIKRGRYRKPVAAIRRLYSETLAKRKGDHAAAKRAVDPLKKKLPAVQFSGVFEGRGDKALVAYSRLLCADLDTLTEAQQSEARTKLAADSYVYGCFQSPSGWGLKVILHVGGDGKQHRQNFLAVKQHIQAVCGLAVDESCKNPERLCFVSDDERAYYNPTALPLAPAQVRNGEAPKVGSDALETRRAIAAELFPPISWQSPTEGWIECPGLASHTTATEPNHTRVTLDQVPTVFCFHEHCRSAVDAANSKLRSRIGRTEAATGGRLTVIAVPGNGDTETELQFARRLEAALPPVRTVGRIWHLYRDGAWRPLNPDTLKPQALAILPEPIRTVRRANTLLDHVEAARQTDPETFRGFYRFEPDGAVLLNVRNGLLRVTADAVEVLPHLPEPCFTHQTFAPFRPSAQAPLFERVLSEVLPNAEDRELFQVCMGNFLLPDCRFEVALCCYGEAGRGKSTVADPVAAALGTDLVCRLSMSQVCDPKSYHLPKLKFSAVNLGTELTTADIGESGNFKTLVSGEPIEARPIYGAPFVMQTACKLWFLANSLPRFRHGTEAEPAAHSLSPVRPSAACQRRNPEGAACGRTGRCFPVHGRGSAAAVALCGNTRGRSSKPGRA